jgi:hypothetical protein
VRLAPVAGPLVLSDLSVAAAGAALDLTDNDLILDYTGGTPGVPSPELENVKAWLAGGYAGMTWTGSGITSSAAALDPIKYGLGYAQNDMLFLPYDVFSGVPVDSSTVLVKFTYLGDLNLDGCVDDNDVTFFNLFYDGGITTGHYWNEGDIFGYDGRIDDNDVTILGLTYGLGIGHPLDGAPSMPDAVPVLAAVDVAPAPVALGAAPSLLVPEADFSGPAIPDGESAPPFLGKATPVGRAPVMARPTTTASRADGFGTLLTIDSATAGAVPLAFGAAEGVAPPRPEPLLLADSETVDLLALPSLEVPLGV